MFDSIGIWELLVLVLLALFIFGPDRLPKLISDAVKILRGVREMARKATTDLSREMGADVRLEDLHPKTFIRKHLLSEEDERALRQPFDDVFREAQQISRDVNDPAPPPRRPRPPEGGDYPGQHRSYDADAT